MGDKIKFIRFEDRAFAVDHVTMVMKKDLPATRILKKADKDGKETLVTEENTRPYLIGVYVSDVPIALEYADKAKRDDEFEKLVDCLNENA